MRVIVAEPTGLCFGVRRAIDRLERAISGYGEVYSLGSPIHNPQEVARLERSGLKVSETEDGIPGGAVVFVRAHGITRGEFERLKARSRVVIDGTCPFVRAAQKRAESLSAEGYKVFVFGDSNHPEVKGILGYIGGESRVIGGEMDIEPGRRLGRVGILSQTTQSEQALAKVVASMVYLSDEMKVYNTICRASLERQEAVRKLAAETDGIVIIGGRNSANTRKLAEIPESMGVPAVWVEHAEELDWRWVRDRNTIGVAAGGSAPDRLIKELTEKLTRLQVRGGCDGNGG
jgi:4-hydroxy-3-methylbut-2-enyl diphosphate reductase